MATLLQIHDLKKSYGSRCLFDNAGFSIAEHDHVGCIGCNGAGKSTLLHIIAGTEHADGGEAICMPETKLGIVEQTDDFIEGESIIAYLERKSDKPEWKCAKLASRFMLKNELLHLPVTTISGGLQMRMKLATMLLQDPNLLLLDEPTNFLDLSTQLLLETFLQDFRGAWIIVSHDREFLERTCDKTMSVKHNTIKIFDGDVHTFLEEAAARLKEAKQYNKKIDTERKHLKEFVDRFRAKASKATQAQDRLKRLAKLHTIDIGASLKTAHIQIPSITEKKGTVLRLQDVSIGYPHRLVAAHIEAEFERGDRIAILGENGQGKSTFLKTLSSELPPLTGNVRWAHNLTIASFTQHVDCALDPHETAGAYLSRASGSLLQEDVLRMAGNFLFSIDDLAKPCHILSGGEKARLILAGILLEKPDVLLLDEPTNHLDMETTEAFGAALREWNGTVFFVSHSRTFVNLIATSIIEITAGKVTRYNGTYEEYVWLLRQRLGVSATHEEINRQLEIIQNPKTTRQERYQELKKKRNHATKLERQMEDDAKEKHQLLDEVLTNPNTFSLERNQRIATLETVIRHTEDEWLKLQDEIHEMELR